MIRSMGSTRRQFLKQGASAGALGVTAAATSLSAAASATLQAAGTATVVLHDPRLAVDAGMVTRLAASGARFIPLIGDPVRLWRGAQRELLSHRHTRLFGVTRWPDFLIVRGLAAETRRRVLHESLDPATGVMTWLIG